MKKSWLPLLLAVSLVAVAAERHSPMKAFTLQLVDKVSQKTLRQSQVTAKHVLQFQTTSTHKGIVGLFAANSAGQPFLLLSFPISANQTTKAQKAGTVFDFPVTEQGLGARICTKLFDDEEQVKAWSEKKPLTWDDLVGAACTKLGG